MHQPARTSEGGEERSAELETSWVIRQRAMDEAQMQRSKSNIKLARLLGDEATLAIASATGSRMGTAARLLGEDDAATEAASGSASSGSDRDKCS